MLLLKYGQLVSGDGRRGGGIPGLAGILPGDRVGGCVPFWNPGRNPDDADDLQFLMEMDKKLQWEEIAAAFLDGGQDMKERKIAEKIFLFC